MSLTAAARRTRRPGLARWAFYGFSVFACAWLATQLYYFAQIAVWNVVNPQSTAFMRSDAWRLSNERGGRADASIQHTWVPYEQISRNLKRAIIASEDARFVSNNGYETDAILQAWEKNKSRGRIVAGGSTIT